MLSRILLALDNSEPGICAQKYALVLAKKHGAAVTGLGILDTPWITAAQPEPLGGGAFKVQRDDAVIQQSHNHLSFLIGEFQTSCEKDGVKYHSIEAEGFPAVEIEKFSHEHDLIVLGRTTDFHFELDEDTDLTVKHVARDNGRPILVITPTVPEGDNVIVAFDGSLQASRSMHIFALLGMAKDKKIHIVAINKDEDIAKANATRAHNLFSAHGIDSTMYPAEQKGNIADQLIDKAHELKASMMVMGGFSKTALRETIFGSNTKKIMKNCDFPLFIHH